MPLSKTVLGTLLVARLFMPAVLAVGLLPLLAISNRRESGAIAAYRTIAVFSLHGNMVVSVDLDCYRSFGSRCGSKRAETYESGSRAGNDCERKNELLHFQIPLSVSGATSKFVI